MQKGTSALHRAVLSDGSCEVCLKCLPAGATVGHTGRAMGARSILSGKASISVMDADQEPTSEPLTDTSVSGNSEQG